MEYRPEIDGLRAVAVLSVIFFHAGFSLFPGGYVGVDIFFVISGFLITKIILRDLLSGSFSLVGFYERRVRRIFPALFVVLVISVPFGWIYLMPDQTKNFGISMLAITAFSSNIFFWRESGYFGGALENNPLLHTWSLSVEEQFYIFFPVFTFISIVFIGKRFYKLALICAFLFSLLLTEWAHSLYPIANFYLIPTRAWELILGSIISLNLHHQKIHSAFKSNLGVLFGILLILISVLYFSDRTPFPSFYTLLPTIGAALIIIFSQKETIAYKILSSSPLVKIGLISYSAYLIHNPIFSIINHRTTEDLNPAFKVFLVIITLVLSYILWRFVEQPFRNKSLISKRLIWSLFPIGLLILFFLGSLTTLSVKDIEKTYAAILAENTEIYRASFDDRIFTNERINNSSNKDIIAVGSSRLMQLNSNLVNSSFENFSVSGATFEDLLALAGKSSLHIKPKKLFLGADPWLFNKNRGDRWKSISNEFEFIKKLISVEVSSEIIFPAKEAETNRLVELLQNIYFTINQTSIIPTQFENQQLDKIKNDGSLVYGQNYTSKEIILSQYEFDIVLNYSMLNYEFDSESYNSFLSFIDYFKNGVEITLFLSPYHPEIYKVMESEYSSFTDMEELFLMIAQLKNVNIVGSYNPEKVGCFENEFYDLMHPKEECIKKALAMTN